MSHLKYLKFHKANLLNKILPNFGRGFTLIEVLVVVSIISLLASGIIANLVTVEKKGRDAQRISQLTQLHKAMLLCYDKYGTYEVYGETTMRDVCVRENLADPDYVSAWSSRCGEFLKDLPHDPLLTDGNLDVNGNYLVLTSDAPDYAHFVLMSKLETPNADAKTPAEMQNYLTSMGIIGASPCAGYNYIIGQ